MPKYIPPSGTESKSNGSKLSDRLQSAQNASKSSPDTERRVKVLYRSECGLYAILRITEDGVSEDYLLQWIANPYIFCMERLEPGRRTSYTVIINGSTFTYCSCDEFNNVRATEARAESCKHTDCLYQLEKTGKLK